MVSVSKAEGDPMELQCTADSMQAIQMVMRCHDSVDDPPADKKLPLTENNFMPTPYAYTQWCFVRENVKGHEVTRRAISLGGRAIAHH